MRQLSNLVFQDGFPIVDLLGPKLSTLKDIQRFRNYVAHDSREAIDGFKKSRDQYVRVGDVLPETVGELVLYRRRAKDDIVLRIVHRHVSDLAAVLKSL